MLHCDEIKVKSIPRKVDGTTIVELHQPQFIPGLGWYFSSLKNMVKCRKVDFSEKEKWKMGEQATSIGKNMRKKKRKVHVQLGLQINCLKA